MNTYATKQSERGIFVAQNAKNVSFVLASPQPSQRTTQQSQTRRDKKVLRCNEKVIRAREERVSNRFHRFSIFWGPLLLPTTCSRVPIVIVPLCWPCWEKEKSSPFFFLTERKRQLQHMIFWLSDCTWRRQHSPLVVVTQQKKKSKKLCVLKNVVLWIFTFSRT